MKLSLNRMISFVAVTVASLSLLTACTNAGNWTYNGSASQRQIRANELFVLSCLGVQVIIQGETVKIVLPDQTLFQVDSANIRDDARFVLNHVSRLIKTYTIENINVNAYSDTQPWPGAPYNQKLGLTNRQAEVIASYLWATGVDMRFVTAKGFSETRPVAWNDTPLGRHFNRRVEIVFRFYPHYVPYN